jgi:hypothetical protein
MPGPKNWSAMSVGTPSRLQYTADLRQFRGRRGCISSRSHVKTSPSTSPGPSLAPAARESPDLGRCGEEGARPLDAMNIGHPVAS